MKPKFTDEEKKEILQLCITKIKRCNHLLDEAYKKHCIATGRAANDETRNDYLIDFFNKYDKILNKQEQK